MLCSKLHGSSSVPSCDQPLVFQLSPAARTRGPLPPLLRGGAFPSTRMGAIYCSGMPRAVRGAAEAGDQQQPPPHGLQALFPLSLLALSPRWGMCKGKQYQRCPPRTVAELFTGCRSGFSIEDPTRDNWGSRGRESERGAIWQSKALPAPR